MSEVARRSDPRGGRAGGENSETVITRPAHIQTKVGTSGTQVRLKANVFKIDEKPNFEFNQYRLDFEPDLEEVMIRKALVGKHISQFGGKQRERTVYNLIN